MNVAHLHFITTCILPDGAPITERAIAHYLIELVAALNMTVLDGPLTSRVDDLDNAPGTTGMILLNTSHASLHTWDRTDNYPAYLQADVYSCKPFNPQIVINLLNRYFAPMMFAADFIDRAPSHILELAKTERGN